jgi:hypothetical protein
VKTKTTKPGATEYVYYRCTRYNQKVHPRDRLRESELDAQVLALFDRMRIDAKDIRDWVVKVLRARVQHVHQEARAKLTTKATRSPCETSPNGGDARRRQGPQRNGLGTGLPVTWGRTRAQNSRTL